MLAQRAHQVGSFQGALANQKAPELGAHAIAAALVRPGVDAAEIDEVIMGNVVSAGLKQRQHDKLCDRQNYQTAAVLRRSTKSAVQV